MSDSNINTPAQIKRTYSRYIMINEDIHQALDGSSLLLYMAFRFFADFAEEDAIIKKSSQALYTKAKISRRQFFISLKKLEHHGLILRESDAKNHSISTYHVASNLGYFNVSLNNSEVISIGDPPVQNMHYPVQNMHPIQYPLSIKKEKMFINKHPKESKIEKTEIPIEEIQQDNPFEIPKELIEQWLHNRRKHPVTKISWTRLNRVLSQLRDKGIDPIDAFERMVANCWRSIEVKYFEQDIKSQIPKQELNLSSTDWGDDFFEKTSLSGKRV